MGYMSIQKHTKDQLHLLREPTFLSKAVFVGFFVGILGILFFGSECCFFKVLIGLCAAGLSIFIVDNYEICEFDKTVSEVRLIRLHWCQYLMNQLISLRTPPYVTAKLEDIKDVRVEEQGGSSSGKAYQVILLLESGIQLGVTEVSTTDEIREHVTIAQLIRSFLDASPVTPNWEEEADDEEEEEASTSEDDFEQISRADLEGLEEDMKTADPASLLVNTVAGGDNADSTPAQEIDKGEECSTATS